MARSKMTKVNKHGVKISTEEIKYIRSLAKSINRYRNIIEKTTSQVIKRPSYRMRKTESKYLPRKASASIQHFTSRENLLKEVQKLESLRKTLMVKPKKLKSANKIKSFKNIIKKVYSSKINRIAEPITRTKITSSLKQKYFDTPFIKNRNKVYRENIMKSVSYTFDNETANKINADISKLNDEQFVDFVNSFPYELVGYLDSNGHSAYTSATNDERSQEIINQLLEIRGN